MHNTDRDNLEAKFDASDDVLDYFETEMVINTARLVELSTILNISALAREAGVHVQTLQAKLRRGTPLSAEETARIVAVLKRYHLATLA